MKGGVLGKSILGFFFLASTVSKSENDFFKKRGARLKEHPNMGLLGGVHSEMGRGGGGGERLR